MIVAFLITIKTPDDPGFYYVYHNSISLPASSSRVITSHPRALIGFEHFYVTGGSAFCPEDDFTNISRNLVLKTS